MAKQIKKIINSQVGKIAIGTTIILTALIVIGSFLLFNNSIAISIESTCTPIDASILNYSRLDSGAVDVPAQLTHSESSKSFSGSASDAVNLGTSISPVINFSVSAWVKPSSLGADRQIISKGYDGTNTQWELKMTTGTGKVAFQSWQGASIGVTSVSSISAGVWTHIVGTYDGVEWKIYIDGVLDNSIIAGSPIATTRRLAIGAVDNRGSFIQNWQGNIDDVRVYGSVLTADDVSRLFSGACSASDVTGPILNLPLEIIEEATSSFGAVVNFSPTATDTDPLEPEVTCIPESGNIFALGTTPVNCSATDAAGNTSIESFDVIVQDTTSPVITLAGADSIVVQVYGIFEDPGADVADNYDPDGTISNQVSGTIDTNTVGVYTRYYDATDSNGNRAVQVSREIRVVDSENPSVYDNVSGEWKNTDATVKFICTDNVECIKVYYTINGDNPTIDSLFVDASTNWEFVISSEGEHTVKYFAVDSSGNNSNIIEASNKLNIDKTAPTFIVNEGTDLGPVKADVINVSIIEALSSYAFGRYGFSDNDSCDIDDNYIADFGSNDNFTIEGNHTDYLCVTTTDGAGNTGYALIGQLNTDNTAPTIFSIITKDVDANGKIDGMELIFNEPINDSMLVIGTADGWDIVGYEGESISTGFVANDNILWLAVTEGSVLDTDATPTATYTQTEEPTSTHDIAGNELASGSWTSTDGVNPIIVSIYATTPTTVVVIFSEELQNNGDPHQLMASDFDVRNGEVSYIVSNVSYDNKVATITLTNSITSGDSPELYVIPQDTSVIDLANNYFNGGKKFSENVVDKMIPVITVPANITLDTTFGDGTVVNYTATATDIFSTQVTLTCLPASGSTFSVGTTTVTCNATDVEGNKAEEKTFDVTINVRSNTSGSGPIAGPALVISNLTSPAISTETLTLTWTTNFPASSYVIYSTESENHVLDMSDISGNPPKYGYANATSEIDTNPKTTSHSVTLTGLDPLTTYYFRTVSRGSLAISGEYKVTTPAVAGAQTQFQAFEGQSTGAGADQGTTSGQESVVPVIEEVAGTESISQVDEEMSSENRVQEDDSFSGMAEAGLLPVAKKYFWPLVIILIIAIGGYGIYWFIVKKKKSQVK